MHDTTLRRAQAGDGDAFRELVEPHRRELLVHCYRILGSLDDAEDMVQEALLAAWRAVGSFDGRALRAWLYRIATNRCLNHVRDEARRPPSMLPTEQARTMDGLAASDEPWWLEPCPDALLDDVALGPEARYDAREAVALSFVAGLQHMPAQQRAVLVLRDVLGFTASEAADILGTTPASVNSALARARAGFRPNRAPEQVPLPRSALEADVVDRFVDAFQRGDVDRVLGVLTMDARLYMPPEPVECRGSAAIAGFLRWRGFWGQGLGLIPTRANGQPAFGYYLCDPGTPVQRDSGVLVLDLSADRVSAMTRFGDGLLPRLGLPRALSRDGS